MKRIFLLLVVVSVMSLSGKANATLSTIGTASYNGTSYNLIYDNDSPFGPIVWLDYSHGAGEWQPQLAWADSLNGSGVVTYMLKSGYSMDWSGDWRLPENVDGSYRTASYDGSTAAGYNITTDEMGHLFYTELGNLGYVSTSGILPQPGWGLTNSGDFENLLPESYWSSTDYAIEPSVTRGVWNFTMGRGLLYVNGEGSGYEAMAVRPGLLEIKPVPIPAAVWLFGSGLLGLFGVRRKIRT